MSLPTGRQVIAAIVVVFIIYAVWTSPDKSADFTSDLWGHIKDGVDSATEFFDGLLNS